MKQEMDAKLVNQDGTPLMTVLANLVKMERIPLNQEQRNVLPATVVPNHTPIELFVSIVPQVDSLMTLVIVKIVHLENLQRRKELVHAIHVHLVLKYSPIEPDVNHVHLVHSQTINQRANPVHQVLFQPLLVPQSALSVVVDMSHCQTARIVSSASHLTSQPPPEIVNYVHWVNLLPPTEPANATDAVQEL